MYNDSYDDEENVIIHDENVCLIPVDQEFIRKSGENLMLFSRVDKVR